MTSIATLSLVRSFEHIGRADVPQVGGKGANLGEMRRAGLPVPPGFVICVEAYERALSSDGSLERIEELLRDLDVDDTAALHRASDAARAMVREIVLPEDVREEILLAYRSAGTSSTAIQPRRIQRAARMVTMPSTAV